MKIKNENYATNLKKLNTNNSMKKIEAIVRTELRDDVVAAIKKNGVDGLIKTLQERNQE